MQRLAGITEIHNHRNFQVIKAGDQWYVSDGISHRIVRDKADGLQEIDAHLARYQVNLKDLRITLGI